MSDEIQVYDHPVLSAHARRLLTVVAAVAALLLGLVSPAQAANGQLTGTVTGQGAGPLEDVWVAVIQERDDDWELVDDYITGADGGYSFSLPPGTYVVDFFPFDEDYREELFDDVHDFDLEAATPVVVSGGGAVVADAELSRVASISGHVTLSPDDPIAAVDVYDGSGDLVRRGYVDDDGSYKVSGLDAGTYRLGFNRLSGFAFSAAEFYDDHPEGAGLAAGDTVTLTDGEARANVDATLVEGGHVTGTLKDSDGHAIRCRLQAFTTDGHLVTRSGWSDPATGTFDIAGLSTGSYLVRVVNGNGCQNGMQYVDGAGGPLSPVPSAADPVSVTLGDATALAPALVYDLGPQPTNVVAPSVTGAPTVDSVLVANHGSWSPSSHLDYHYQWLAGGAELPGATRRTYHVTQGDVGRSLAVRVTVNRGPRTASATSAATGPVSAPALLNLKPPNVVGSPSVNARMTVTSPGLWSMISGLTYTYTWSSAGVVHQSSTNPLFLIPDAAYGLPLSLRVTATGPGGQSGHVDVLAAAGVKTGRWDRGKPQRIRGGASVGAVVRVTYAKLSPKPDKPRCTWYRNGQTIPGAHGTSYRLQPADADHEIRVGCRYTLEHYKPLVLVSRLPRMVHD